MQTWLLFVLEAPLAALGDVAVGERRYGIDRPAKSAVLGLLAAALGIERHDDASHAALHEGYGYAVRVTRAGRLIEDYQTTQVPAARRNQIWATRREELASPSHELETILSMRDYRADARYDVALWPRPGARWPLPAFDEALRRPAFTLYLGRKACPLGRPPTPLLTEAATLEGAFAALDEAERGRDVPPLDDPCPIHADRDVEALIGDGLVKDRLVQRRDRPVSPQAWQVGLREEVVLRSKETTGEPLP
jgi:CRISPR system Cascade subunit CasD